ncbi:PREDICTED: cordon-bleu protein-like 1 isoform X2 [Ficedula albicollis]|nr:PREDICTED: cordon-bleu protein-like 1 isoform X2 [Ficedula albicollis]XP_016155274.1 PREDICTED: cordon-bleu protein-like 1 isoform X2 [Ficedula albicollis]XP_016155275.1 PREDICTED: cordon-bleu protein-like 1 isoform X2 [Ficedula albicollis]XP_016155276.1 PREDICTED: cordon-bleu protein-like 1 isoform X2 [Ficedula albicollis]XP_016155277.1 PREDICTED: cordon-bleu protein-like 1 isoform X2 [Ficedula albicollis]XP_016155278.1 PREDICTED: cordon-bleu protein-like 1 isoform X2 [Ficedula albicollis]
MEQKENVIDKDIELSVVLPGDVIKYTTVNGRKPMMDLLIFLCAQYHLNPSSYTIELVSAENSQIKFKPNTPVGMLEVEKVIVKAKQIDKKKPAPVIPEQTVRVVINYKKTQKTVVRVSPHSPLQELIPVICSKCEFDPSHTLLLKSYQSQEPLDMTKSLNDLGLRELYAMDISQAASPVDLNLPSFQGSYQSENIDALKEKENKGFFSFFQRNKKKREQAASAPATPLMSKPRPVFITRSSTVSKQYDSSTLPAEMPKKRRAPLPPLASSRSAPQGLAPAPARPGLVRSSSFERNEQAPVGLVRKGSLPLSDTASVNSSLRRMKRKAPSPPSRAPEDQSESSNEPVTESTESAPAKAEGRATEMKPETDIRNSEYNLEEIDEREEISVQQGDDSGSTSTSPGIGEVTAAFSSAEVPLENDKNDPASSAPVPGSVPIDNLQSFKEEKQENMSTDGKGLQTKISSEDAGFQTDRKPKILGQNKADDHSDAKILPATEEKELQTAEIKTVDFRENNNLEVDRLSNCQACKNDISVSHRNYPQLISEKQDDKTNQTGLDTVKTQDVGIQTLDSNLGRTVQKEVIVSQGVESSTFSELVPQHDRDKNSSLVQVMHAMHQESEDTSIEQNLQTQEVAHKKVIPVKDQSRICINGSDFASPETTAEIPDDSPIKSHPFYRQDTKPRPKPANEITRDYIPKIGMTTYKIVPPKFLEMMKSWESEVLPDHKDQEITTLEDPKEFIVQTEIPHLSKSVCPLQAGSQNEAAAANGLLQRVNSISEHTVTSGAEITTESNQMERQSSKQHVPLMLNLDNTNASSETLDKSNALSPLSPTTKPSSFYLQMQRRASGQYVTSAVARSTVCAPNSIQNEVKNTEMSKKISSPDLTSSALQKTSIPSPPADQEKVDDGKNIESSTSPVKSNKPLSFPSCPPAPLNLRTLRTFAVPKPYSSSRPSPFALAVSSAVKRSQSFNKTRTITSQAPREELPVELSSVPLAPGFPSAASMPEVKSPSLQTVTAGPQNSQMDKKGSHVHSEQKSQAQSGASPDHPRPVTKRQTAMTLPRADPEQIHQSLLAAIRSGEAAAKLKRVGPPSNTVAVNGRARLNPLYSTESKANP